MYSEIEFQQCIDLCKHVDTEIRDLGVFLMEATHELLHT